MQITHFTELRVYQRSFALAGSIFLISKRWPSEERFALTDQVRRAARSVGANISEAWGKRRYEAHFVSKLSDADAENHETEHWLLSARRDGYLAETELSEMLEAKKDVGRMLGAMMQNPGPFLLK
jgi:four helix bundle protein